MNQVQEKIYNELISKYNFNRQQKEEIRIGLEQGLDVSWYAKPDFTWIQMEEIRLGLEANIDVSIYSYPGFTDGQMEQFRSSLIWAKSN